MPTAYDVAVIGDGIAGAAAVISMSQAGINLVWLRPALQTTISQSEHHKVGESLAPAANPILASLGLSHLLENNSHRAANATFSAWGQGALVERNSAVHLEGAGCIINRVKFEHDLFFLASNACACVIDDTLQSVMEDDEGIWQLTSHSGTQLAARFIIDATGRSQVVSRALIHNGKAQSETNDHLVAAYGFLQQKNNTDVLPTPATLIESVENGWWYASLLPSGELTLNYYCDPDLMPRGLTSDLDVWLDLIQQTTHIAYWIEDAQFEVNTPPQLASAATRWLMPAAGVNNRAGWAAIGDAAVAFDPLSAHGMTTALWAAARAPDFVKGYLSGDNQVLNQYAEAVEDGRKQYLQQRNTIYAQEKRFQHSEFWKRRAHN